MEARTAVLRPDLHSKETLEFKNKLRAKIVGQEAGIELKKQVTRSGNCCWESWTRPLSHWGITAGWISRRLRSF